MTRLAFLADIHANLPALEAVLEDMKQFHFDQVIVVGDSISVGTFSVEVLAIIQQHHWAVIRGNHEFYLLHHETAHAPENWSQYTLPRWLNAHIAPSWVNYIASLPDELTLWFRDTPPIFVTHGVPGSPWDGIARYTSEKRLVELGRMIKPDFLIVGHTHLQLDRTIHFDDRSLRIFNPGAVGIPLDGQPMANYMILDSSEAGWTPTFRRVRYDVEKMLQAFRQVDYVEHTGAVGRMFIEEIRLARPIVAPYLRWKSQYYPDQMETMTMAEEFLRLPPEKIWSLLPFNYQINPQFPIQFGTW